MSAWSALHKVRNGSISTTTVCKATAIWPALHTTVRTEFLNPEVPNSIHPTRKTLNDAQAPLTMADYHPTDNRIAHSAMIAMSAGMPGGQEHVPCILRLPAELRLQIYKLVLGNHFIHLDGKGGSSKDCPQTVVARGCQRLGLPPLPNSPKSCENSIYHVELCHERGQFAHRKLLDIDLHLLQTNRQIYHEAKMIPFSTNMFSVPNWATLFRFALDTIKPWQWAAIKNLRFAADSWTAVQAWKVPLPPAAEKPIVLPSLNRLRIDVVIYSSEAERADQVIIMQNLRVFKVHDFAVVAHGNGNRRADTLPEGEVKRSAGLMLEAYLKTVFLEHNWTEPALLAAP